MLNFQIAHMTKSPIEYVDSILIGPAMLFLNQYFNSILPEYYVLCVCLVKITTTYFKYVSLLNCMYIYRRGPSLIQAFTQYLFVMKYVNIYVFTYFILLQVLQNLVYLVKLLIRIVKMVAATQVAYINNIILNILTLLI